MNLLADRALEVGCERQARTIDTRFVREAARRLNLQPAGIPRWQMQVAAAAAVILLLAGGVGWKAIAQRSQSQDAAPTAAETAAAAVPQATPEIRTLDVRESVTVTSRRCGRSSGRPRWLRSSSKPASRRSRAAIPTASHIR